MITEKIKGLFDKKTLLILFVIGVVIMLIPKGTNSKNENYTTIDLNENIDEKKLENVIKEIDGVEKVKIFITYQDNGTLDYAYDISGSNTQRSVEIKMSDKKPVVAKSVAPKVAGILAVVKTKHINEIDLCNIIKSATGVPLHRISVVCV